MSLFFYFGLVILSAYFFAKMEVQIEGKHGWAEKLPTWRLYKTWFKYIPGGNKPLTGYLLFLWLFILSLSHLPFLLQPWSLGKELIVISFVILLLRLEDFLWFVVNPDFGLKKFRQQYIPWHNSWLGPLPIQYYVSIVFWVITFYLGLKLSGLN